ncbi:ABC transporter permease [Fictibacillus sp. Mic-4]|uniref:ABC transporter permease n=1 Tax=Fictibacillus TaxID=1329200 RepID=UPI00042859DD|nr:ABC transporter permease [Fictibacillus gelatini]
MVWGIFKKELIDSLRDRKTIVLSVLIPIILNAGLMLLFDRVVLNKSEDTMTIAVNQNSQSTIYKWLYDMKNTKIKELSDPMEAVKDGDAQVGIKVGSDFDQKLKNGGSPELTIYSDSGSSKSSAAVETVKNIISMHEQTIVNEKLQSAHIDPKVLNPFQMKVKNVAKDDDGGMYLVSLFAQIIIVLGVMMGGVSAANDLFAGEKERKTMEALLITPVKRSHLITGKWLTISVLGAITGIFSTVTLVVFIKFFTTNLPNVFDLEHGGGKLIAALLIAIILFAFLVASIQVIFSLFANTMKEAQNYISPLMLLGMLPYYFLITVSVNEMTTMHFIIPFLNIYALIKQLIYGVYSLQNVLLTIGSTLVCIVIFFTIARVMFGKDRWVLEKS